MDARTIRAVRALLWLSLVGLSLGANYRTQHFIVTAATDGLAREIGDAAEDYRTRLAVEWLGKELPEWSGPCPITANISPQLGAGGATSFMFDQGRPFGWRMTVQGSRERVLDSVLPHEVTHTIFATHFGRPLPRWADEGACTTVEHVSERQKQQDLLIQFLSSGRGIPFHQMFAMKEYPPDILPLYAQGFSLARFLIAQGGKRKYIEYVGDGMRRNNWTAVTKEHYGLDSLSDLQVAWLDWVRQGSPMSSQGTVVLASNTRSELPAPTPVAALPAADDRTGVASRNALPTDAAPLVPVPAIVGEIAPSTTLASLSASPSSAPGDSGSWYVRQRDLHRAARTPTPQAVSAVAPPELPPEQSVTRPTGLIRPGQIVLEARPAPSMATPIDTVDLSPPRGTIRR